MRRRGKRERDVITCRLCGKQFRAISYSHLRYQHGWDDDHPIVLYKQRFHLRHAHCTETRELISERHRERLTQAGVIWSPARFKAAVRQPYQHVQSGQHYQADDLLVRTGRKLCGSWPKAVRAAGVDYEELTGRTVWTSSRIVREIRAVARSRRKHATHVSARLSDVAERRFGSWQRAVEAAGLDYDKFTKVRRLMSPDALLPAIRRLARERKAGTHVGPRAPHPLYDAAIHHFGSWEAAVHAAKVDYRQFTGKTRWSRERVVSEIRKLAKVRRKTPASTPPPLRQAAKRLFGSWGKAVRAAGFDRLDLIRLRWKRESQGGA